ncbi:MAG: hypothetical protein M3P70_02435 [Actinomycetota bacterium]|nr:hypothetical protein [Actinomycetota bacterium]
MIGTDPYWTEDLEIGVTELDGEPYGVRLRVASQRERYWEGQELVPVTRRGERLYVHAQAYILWPVITLTAGLPAAAAGGALGVVLDSEYTGVRPVEIGDAQGWYYPEDRTAVLWECLVGESYRAADPSADRLLALLWEGFERVLLERSPGARRIVSPSWEPLYEPPAWHRFLEGRGYAPVAERAWGKEVGR